MASAARGADDFNPRSPHGERLVPPIMMREISNFNPRSPHGERRVKAQRGGATWSFQSTLPARGATSTRSASTMCAVISIHAPRTGSDRWSSSLCAEQSHFNPRSPHGERHTGAPRRRPCGSHFNPRSPHGERRRRASSRRTSRYFNPRSPHGERRRASRRASARQRNFNPRSPHGERQPSAAQYPGIFPFQSTLPARGATRNLPHHDSDK